MNLRAALGVRFAVAVSLAVPLVVSLIVPDAARAASYRLFESHGNYFDQVEQYDEIMRSLRPGDELVFSHGRSYRIGREVGRGGTTIVLEIQGEPGKLLRIPKGRGIIPETESHYGEYITSYQTGEPALRNQNVPVVKVFEESVPGEFAVVEEVPGAITLRDYLDGKTKAPLSAAERVKMNDALVDFARKASGFTKIGDFHSGQLVYSAEKNGWVLIDWTSSHRTATRGSNPFHSIFVGGPEYREDFFFEFAKNVAPAGKVEFAPLKPKDQWIAELANRIVKATEEARIERFRVQPEMKEPGPARVEPARVKSCVLYSLFSVRR